MQQIIGLGTEANDGTGDSARVGGQKINDNFSELYLRDTQLLQSIDDVEQDVVANFNQLQANDEQLAVDIDEAEANAKAYADSLVISLWDDRGNYNPTITSAYPVSGGSGPGGSILKEDVWLISATGTINGQDISQGQTIRALIDSPGQSHSNWAFSVGATAIPGANETVPGKVEEATDAEMQAGTGSSPVSTIKLFVAPDKLLTWWNWIKTQAQTITNIWSVPTAAIGTNTQQIANCAFVNQQIDESVVDLGTISAGTLTLDLTRKNHRVVLTGNITLDYLNLVTGREYTLRIERATNTTITWAANKWAAPLGQQPALTNPLTNGSAPAKAVDIITFRVWITGNRAIVVITPDAQNI